jgi:uncharacterized protein (TIGR02147 family)
MKQVTFREFITARYFELKRNPNLKYSFRTFSALAGFGSPNYLKVVMDGKRMISVKAIPKFAKGLLLNEAEISFFTDLALREIATNSAVVKEFLEAVKTVNEKWEEESELS